MASRSTAEYNKGRVVTCRGCGKEVNTSLHFDLSGYCPKRAFFGDYPATLDDPSFIYGKSYSLRRQMLRGNKRNYDR